ncbi:ABC transporter permease [Confluentibacter sediminis]|uniref:ABC transporter permease n=1 Tax=Confluentibacter sediminis TaxID=2219045 RepID=UPI000DABD61E|nr:ABC transporter permease [Confluentibacter sediminis]
MNIIYHLKLVYRNFINQRPYSFLNLAGLSVGLCIAFIVLLYVTEETGYDSFHKNSKDIYRLLLKNSFDNEKTTTINVAISKRFKEEVPEIKKMFVYEHTSFTINDSVREYEAIGASSGIVDILSFNLIEGNLDAFKTKSRSIIISEATALKYFKKTAVLGESLNLEGGGKYPNGEFDYGLKADYTIVAVFKNFPKKSLFKPNIIIPIENSKRYQSGKAQVYSASDFQTFLSLVNNADVENVAKKINKIGKEIDKKHNGRGTVYGLQAIEDIHLFSDDVNETQIGSIKKVMFYVIIGALALIISLLNFLLLYTAITKRQFKEFSIHKVHGLKKIGLLKIFFFETIVISLVSSIMAIFLMKIAIPWFNEFTDSRLISNGLENFEFVVYGCLLVVLLSIVAGMYFTYYVWRHNTIEILSNNNSKKGANFFLKNGAVVTQIGIVSLMLVFTIGVYRQLDFMINTDKGYHTENLLVVKVPESKADIYKEALLQYPIIESVAFGYSLASSDSQSMIITTMVNDSPASVKVNSNNIDQDYIPMYQLKLIKGRNFNETDKDRDIILNETAVKYLGLQDNPIGQNRFLGNVIGVVKDFHFSSFRKKIEPYAFYIKKRKKAETKNIGYDFVKDITIKYKKGKYKNAVKVINTIKEENNYSININPPHHIDSLIENLYRSEKTLQKAVLILTGIIIFITLLGLIGMTLFKTEQSTKEIGIRKVNGATIKEIMIMLNKDFIKSVLIAFVIACPIAYYAMSKWLENFAYKTDLSWWVFAIAGIITLVIALLTVSWQTYKAATRNPVESLRDE